MNMKIKAGFLKMWAEYFPGAELPLTWYYTDDEGRGQDEARSRHDDAGPPRAGAAGCPSSACAG